MTNLDNPFRAECATPPRIWKMRIRKYARIFVNEPLTIGEMIVLFLRGYRKTHWRAWTKPNKAQAQIEAKEERSLLF